MIQINDLHKAYNGNTVVNLPFLEILEGESVGLVGNNGAGKTTLFRLILNLIKADRGTVKINGNLVTQSTEWKSYTGSFLDESFLISFLRPEEYFEFIADINQVSKEELTSIYDKFSEFFNGEVLNQRKYIRDFSKGNQKKIGIASAIISQPKVLILDEPFANLDPTSQILLKNILNDLHQQSNLTMLISSHNLTNLTEVSQRFIVLERGELVKDIIKSDNAVAELTEYFNF